MSKAQPVSEAEADVPARPQPVDPLKNPSYPQRVHIHERMHWQEILRRCEQRIATARQELNGLGDGPNRAAFERLYAQMLGARDQVADAARRLPVETGDLYAEDKQRVHGAVAALERSLQRWEAQKA